MGIISSLPKCSETAARLRNRKVSFSVNGDRKSQALEGYIMKVSVLPWHVFWEACERQTPATPNGWLRRWVFTDDGVGISVKSQSGGENDSGKPIYTVGHAEGDPLLNEAPPGKILTRGGMVTDAGDLQHNNNGFLPN